MNITKLHVKKYLLDTGISLVYYTPLMSLAELYIAQMERAEIIDSRMINISLSLLTAKPYTWYRKKLAGWLKTTEYSSSTKKYLTETLAAFTFYNPQYLVALLYAGADKEEMTYAFCVSTAMVLTSRVFGRVRDKVISKFGLEGLLNDTHPT